MDAQEKQGTAGGGGSQAHVDFMLPQVIQAFATVCQQVRILSEGQSDHMAGNTGPFSSGFALLFAVSLCRAPFLRKRYS